MFNYFVPTVKIKVQNLSTKASSPRVYGSEGPSRGLCGGAKGEEERELPTVCAQECKDSRAAGAGEVVGTVVGEAPLGQPGTLPLSNGRIPWYRVKLSAQRFEKLLQNKDIIEKYHVNRNNPNAERKPG